MKLPFGREQKTFEHGVHPPQFKEPTAAKPIRRMAFAPQMIVPLAQHIGTPALPIVREGQEVVRGEPIAKPDGANSVPMHSPVTGVVSRIALAPTPIGTMTPAIFIKTYPGASQEVLYGAPRNMAEMSPEDLLQAIQETGMVGLGGAAYPTHAKLRKPVDTMIVNGCECEPYLTKDHRLMLERQDDILTGIDIVAKTVRATKIYIGIEDNKPDAVETLRAAIAARNMDVTVESFPTKYPQGAKKMLITSLLGKEVPSGGRSSEAGALVINVATVGYIGALVPQRQGLIERVVTITGSGVAKPGNYMTPIGTPLGFALEQAGFSGTSRQVVLGGPMMGTAVNSLATPITKGVMGIIALTEEEARAPRQVYPCIKCGSCLDACPMKLNPSRLGLLARKRMYQEMQEQFHLNDCFECGCCSYVCPSNIPLVQLFRVAKNVNWQRRQRTEPAKTKRGER